MVSEAGTKAFNNGPERVALTPAGQIEAEVGKKPAAINRLIWQPWQTRKIVHEKLDTTKDAKLIEAALQKGRVNPMAQAASRRDIVRVVTRGLFDEPAEAWVVGAAPGCLYGFE